MPVSFAKYAITQGFGETDEPLDSPLVAGGQPFNKGLDFGMPIGTLVDAAAGGTVESVGNLGDGWGVSIKIRDTDGYLHNYGHLSAVNVRQGQKVSAGAFIAKSGNTGKSTGPHLSYDVQTAGGDWIDPTSFVQSGKPPTAGGRRGPEKPGDTIDDELGATDGDGGGGSTGNSWYADDVTGDQRVSALTAAGYKFKAAPGLLARARGKSAGADSTWIAPNGADVRESDALAALSKKSQRAEADGATELDMLKKALRARQASGLYDEQTMKMLELVLRGQDVEKKQLTLTDGTVITKDMINDADPIVAEQYRQALSARRSDYENESRAALNQLALQEYQMGRTAVTDRNANANNDFRNRVEAVREKLALGKIPMEEAAQEVSRIIKGMGESRDRAELEISTALKAAPFATSGGKTSFTGQDLGAATTRMAQIAGIKNPETTPLISFPGTQKIDVAGLLAAGDRALGVADTPLPQAPTIDVAALLAQLPTPPTLEAGPQVPTLRQPVVPPSIRVPQTDYEAEAEMYGLNRR